MPTPDTGNTYFHANSAIRDVHNTIMNISPQDTPFTSMLSEVQWYQTKKEVYHDTTGGGLNANNALVEGAEFTDDANVPRTSTSNYCQIFTKVVNVSETLKAVQQYGMSESELAYQLRKRSTELAKDIEYTFINGTANAGTSASARKTGGLIATITTNVVTGAVATASTTAMETKLNDLFQLMFETGTTVDGVKVMVNGTYKRYISALTLNVTRQIDASSKVQVNSVNAYDSDFGVVHILLNRYIPTGNIVAVNLNGFRRGYLRKIAQVPLAKVGDNDRYAMVGELALDCLSEKEGGKLVFS
jgi:hypothetical protein